MSRHRRSDTTETRRAVAGIIALLVIISLFVVAIVSAFTERGKHDPTPVPTVTVTKPVPQPTKTVTVAPKPANADALSQARRMKPLSKLIKGDRVINEQNPARPLCTFQLWSGSIAQAVIQCEGGSQQITIKTGFLTPVEVLQ